ncbi:MAG TPA: glycerophosphodiester phosphodiesterase family protein [Pirellulaceae bacterium]|nr:glycerophosphodiester phosphodiesterase family protein [Pirellulaceae bacterium]
MKLPKTLLSWVLRRHRTRPILTLCCGLLTLLVTSDGARGQLIIAHRGASYDAPENTLAAFRLAWRQGADGVEGDFYLTKDGQIVCIHDADTKRTAGVNRQVAKSTLAELRELDVGRWKDEEFAGERMPTLQQVLATVPNGRRIFIEIKCGPEIVPVLRDVLSRAELDSRQIAVISFQQDVIAATKQQLPDIKAYWLTGYKQDKITHKWQPTMDQILKTLQQTGADGLDTNAHASVVDADFVKRLRRAGMDFHCWTVDDPVVATRLQSLGVTSITTNRPKFLRQELPTSGLYQYLDVHLKLDGDLKDASPHHRHAVLTGSHGVPPIFKPAVFGQGLDLQKNNGTPSVQHKLPPQGSICLWYYARDWYDYQTVLDNTIHRQAWEFWIYQTGQARFRINPGGAVVSHQFHPTGDVNEWHHIALTWDRHDVTKQALRLYVNGHPSDSSGWELKQWTAPGDRFYLGGGNDENTHGNGMWDDVAVFRRVLSRADVRQIISAGVQSLKPVVSVDSTKGLRR